MLPVPDPKTTLVPRKAAQTDTLQASGTHCLLGRYSNTPTNFYKVIAHTGIIGHECADVIAKHAAVHDNGHDVAIPPPTPDGNPYSHMYWIASDDTAANHT